MERFGNVVAGIMGLTFFFIILPGIIDAISFWFGSTPLTVLGLSKFLSKHLSAELVLLIVKIILFIGKFLLLIYSLALSILGIYFPLIVWDSYNLWTERRYMMWIVLCFVGAIITYLMAIIYLKLPPLSLARLAISILGVITGSFTSMLILTGLISGLIYFGKFVIGKLKRTDDFWD